MPKLINLELLANPMNYIVVTAMLLMGVIVFEIVRQVWTAQPPA